MSRTPKRQESEDGPDLEEARRAAAAANRLEELRLVLLGWRWPGKSLTGNTILGREEFRLERAAEFCVKRQTEAEGRQVTVVDTPGWFSSQNTPPTYQQEILKGASMCPPGPHALLLVIPVGMFSDVDRGRIAEHMALFGERAWRHTLVVFTWSEVLKDISIERYIRREGRDLKWVLERCGKRYFVIDNNVWGEHPQLGRLFEAVEKMVAEVGGAYVPETAEEKAEKEEGKEERKVEEEVKGPPEGRQTPQEGPAGGRDLGARPKHNSAPRLCSEPL
ncbi:GTPase IMAP family member 4 [Gadus morhua]|uniref:GTPase IMAP family member 4 n=1 Tax=Gadus morhua TaxID=8049 RepID=UPI0011B6F0AC|nr:GTPase IMAP family member 9-like [Gadus morhua]